MSVWLTPSLLAVAATAGMLVFVWRRPPPPPLWPFLPAVFLGGLLFACGDLYATHLAETPFQVWLGCLGLYAGLSILGPGMFTLALRFAEANKIPFSFGRAAWTRAPWFAAGGLWLALLTNPLHGQFLTPIVGSRNEYGVLWYLFSLTAYLGTLVAIGLFATIAIRAPSPTTRDQARLMTAACSLPLVPSILYVSLPFSLPFDPTALGVAITNFLMIVGVYRGQLFALTPVAFWELLQQDSDALLVLDRSQTLLYANPTSETLFSHLSLGPGQLVLPEIASSLRRADEHAVLPRDLLAEDRSAEKRSTPLIFRFGAEPHRWLSVETTPLRGPGDQTQGYCLRIRDETELQEANAAVGEQAAALAAVLTATDDAFVVTSVDGVVLYANERYEDLFGVSDIVGKPASNLMQNAQGRMDLGANAGDQLEEIQRHPELTRSGSATLDRDRFIDWRYYPLSLDGRITGRVWQIRDVTEQRRAAEHLRETQKAESLGVIAGGVAHDFNNLLAVIQGNATLARKAAPEEDERIGRFLADIENASERASELTEQLLAYTGRGARQIREHDVSQVVAEVRNLLEVSISKRVALECSLQEDLPLVRADVAQLRQVVMNLVLNAAESVSGDGTVYLTTDEVELTSGDIDGMLFGSPTPGRFIRLRVEDSGCGMSQSTLARIFEPFFTTKFAGRGLGLAATMGVIRGHGGAMRVDSQLGRGSSFTVYLPISTTAAVAARA